MPRRAFIADLQQAFDGTLPDTLFDIQPGDDDGMFTFLYKPKEAESVAIAIQALVAGKLGILRHT